MTYVITHLFRSIECTTPRVNPNIDYELWVIMMCQCRFILGKKKKYTTLVSDTDNGGDCACVGAGDMGNLCTSLSIFCKPKIALKQKALKF